MHHEVQAKALKIDLDPTSDPTEPFFLILKH